MWKQKSTHATWSHCRPHQRELVGPHMWSKPLTPITNIPNRNLYTIRYASLPLSLSLRRNNSFRQFGLNPRSLAPLSRSLRSLIGSWRIQWRIWLGPTQLSWVYNSLRTETNCVLVLLATQSVAISGVHLFFPQNSFVNFLFPISLNP